MTFACGLARYLSEADGVDGSSYCYRPSGCRSGYCDLKFQLVVTIHTIALCCEDSSISVDIVLFWSLTLCFARVVNSGRQGWILSSRYLLHPPCRIPAVQVLSRNHTLEISRSWRHIQNTNLYTVLWQPFSAQSVAFSHFAS